MSEKLPFWATKFFDFKSSKPINRITYTGSHAEFTSRVVRKMAELGMSLSIDDIGNICGSIEGSSANPSVCISSHTDSVIDGGQFDGLAGIILGLVTIEKLLLEKKTLNGNIKLIICAAEESTRFKSACLGSKYLAGKLSTKDFSILKDANNITLKSAAEGYISLLQQYLSDIPITKVSHVISKKEIDTAIELHIEQYESLFESENNIGIVTSICAPYRAEVTINGFPDHSGSTPMDKRADSILALSYLAIKLNEFALHNTENIRATLTKIEQLTEPSINTISEKSYGWIDIRQQYPFTASETKQSLQKIVTEIENLTNTTFNVSVLTADTPIQMNPTLVQKLYEISTNLGLKTIKMPSWAGHDLAYIPAKEAVLIFIPSTGGSHNPLESTTEENMVNGCKVMFQFLKKYFI